MYICNKYFGGETDNKLLFFSLIEKEELYIFVLPVLVLLTESLALGNESGVVLLGADTGRVVRENFTYYYIYHSGDILLNLRTIYGDADMYVSDTDMLPTYDPVSYDLHSATCGEDKIEIPEGYKSPFAVGVYGHSAYEMSEYILEVYQNYQDSSGSFLIIEQGSGDGKPGYTQQPYKKGNEKIIKTAKKIQSNAAKISSIFSLFEILELVFL